MRLFLVPAFLWYAFFCLFIGFSVFWRLAFAVTQLYTQVSHLFYLNELHVNKKNVFLLTK
jgi:hypothetical protein